jgi:iron complex outermembrane receptor protein
VDSNAQNTTQVRQDGLALTINDHLGNNQLTSITGFEGFQTTAFSDSDDTPLELGRGYNNGDTHQLSEELRLASPRSDRFNWVIGGMYFTEDINSTTVTSILPDAATGATPSGVAPKFLYSSFQQHTDSYSAFASGTFNFTDQFNVTAGVRYTEEDKSDNLDLLSATGKASSATSLAPYNNVSQWWLPGSVNGLTTVGTQDASKDWGALTYDLTPEFKLTENARLYFRYAHGFRAGGFNSSATSQANIDIVNPEYLTSYELGAKTEWLDGQLIANADVFHYDYSDIQVNVVTSGVSFLTNAGKGKADGAEFTLEALPVDNLHLRLNTGWLNTRFTDYTTGGISYAGNQFVRSPHLSVVFNADYHVPLPNGNEILFGTDWKYQSKYFFYSNDQVDPNVTQNGYTLGDARASYVVGNISFTAYVENLTNKIYKDHTLLESNSTAPVPSNIYLGGDAVVWSEGRIVGASVKVKW